MVRVMVSIVDDRLGDMSTVVEALRGAGLTVTEVLDNVGVVTGTVDSGAVASLSRVPGVADVETQREVRLPPPDSPLQ